MKKLLTMLLAVLMVLSIAACGGTQNNAETFAWNDLELSEKMPESESKVGRIISNSETSLCIYIHNTSKEQYKEYVKKCEDFGYTVESDKMGTNYSAFNAEGYKLSLWYNESDKELSISLDAPIEMSELQWPGSGVAELLPVPKSNLGKLEWENSSEFLLRVGNTTPDEFKEYINACSAKGFNVDFQKGDDYYYADDSNGNHISLNYEGNNVMRIQARTADEEEQVSEEITTTEVSGESTASAEVGTETVSSDGIGSEFKAAMDSYEKFFDEYVAIMKKYMNNPSDVSILSDYSKFMGQYAQTMEEFNEWGDKDLNAAELAYFAQVEARIANKLLEVAQ